MCFLDDIDCIKQHIIHIVESKTCQLIACLKLQTTSPIVLIFHSSSVKYLFIAVNSGYKKGIKYTIFIIIVNPDIFRPLGLYGTLQSTNLSM